MLELGNRIQQEYINGVFTPEQDNDKTTRQMINLCIPMIPFTPDMSDRCERHHRNAQVQHLSCRCLVVVLLWCENTIRSVNRLWAAFHYFNRVC